MSESSAQEGAPVFQPGVEPGAASAFPGAEVQANKDDQQKPGQGPDHQGGGGRQEPVKSDGPPEGESPMGHAFKVAEANRSDQAAQDLVEKGFKAVRGNSGVQDSEATTEPEGAPPPVTLSDAAGRTLDRNATPQMTSEEEEEAKAEIAERHPEQGTPAEREEMARLARQHGTPQPSAPAAPETAEPPPEPTGAVERVTVEGAKPEKPVQEARLSGKSLAALERFREENVGSDGRLATQPREGRISKAVRDVARRLGYTETQLKFLESGGRQAEVVRHVLEARNEGRVVEKPQGPGLSERLAGLRQGRAEGRPNEETAPKPGFRERVKGLRRGLEEGREEGPKEQKPKTISARRFAEVQAAVDAVREGNPPPETFSNALRSALGKTDWTKGDINAHELSEEGRAEGMRRIETAIDEGKLAASKGRGLSRPGWTRRGEGAEGGTQTEEGREGPRGLERALSAAREHATRLRRGGGEKEEKKVEEITRGQYGHLQRAVARFRENNENLPKMGRGREAKAIRAAMSLIGIKPETDLTLSMRRITAAMHEGSILKPEERAEGGKSLGRIVEGGQELARKIAERVRESQRGQAASERILAAVRKGGETGGSFRQSLKDLCEKTLPTRFAYRQASAFLNKFQWADKEKGWWVAGMATGAIWTGGITVIAPVLHFGPGRLVNSLAIAGVNVGSSWALNRFRLASITKTLGNYIEDKGQLKETAQAFDKAFRLIRGGDKEAFEKEIERLSDKVASGGGLRDEIQENMRSTMTEKMLGTGEKYKLAQNSVRSFAAGLSVGTIGVAGGNFAASFLEGGGAEGVSPTDQPPGDLPVDQPPGDLPVDQPPGDLPVDQPPGDLPVDQSLGDLPVDQPPDDQPAAGGTTQPQATVTQTPTPTATPEPTVPAEEGGTVNVTPLDADGNPIGEPVGGSDQPAAGGTTQPPAEEAGAAEPGGTEAEPADTRGAEGGPEPGAEGTPEAPTPDLPAEAPEGVNEEFWNDYQELTPEEREAFNRFLEGAGTEPLEVPPALDASDFTEAVIHPNDTVGHVYIDSGYDNIWEANAENAALRAETIAENRELLEQGIRNAAGAGIAVQELPTDAELIDLAHRAAAGDYTAMGELNEALHWVPTGETLKIVKAASIEDAVEDWDLAA